MVAGHLAVALASKKLAPTTSLVWLVLAANLLDLVWPILLIVGVEHARVVPGATAFNPLVFDSYPWTHSLLMVVIWGVALGALARAAGVARGAAPLIGALVVSHWMLDLVTHGPDLPLWPGQAGGYGLGLWNSIPATFLVEGALWIAGIAIFLRVRRPQGWVGRLAFWSFVVVSTFIWASGPYSPPPAESGLGWFALIGWIIVPWAWWIERTSSASGPSGARPGEA